MKLKKYTLYFRGINEYGHEHNIPVICLNLRQMDEYTSNFDNYLDLFNNFPEDVKKFFQKQFNKDINFEDNKSLSEHFFITDNDFLPIMDLVFKANDDVLYVTLDELTDNIIKAKMTNLEFQNSILETNVSSKEKKKYEFFNYLYYTYVKDKKISCMIDVYDASKSFSNLQGDSLMVASIATNKDNIMVLCKKLGQEFESRRNLTFKYKALFNHINGNKKMSCKDKFNSVNLTDSCEAVKYNINKFEKKYIKEYNSI